MRGLAQFFSILQLTREQPQYGYFLVGVKNEQTSNLAEHHYLVAMMGWWLAEYINENEEKPLVDTAKVIQLCLVHDVGELFGGDVAALLSRTRPDMKQHARALEASNHALVVSFLHNAFRARWFELVREDNNAETDEGIVANVADKIETQYFLEHLNIKDEQREVFYRDHVRTLVEKMHSQKIREKLNAFFDAYEAEIKNKGFQAGDFIIESARSE